MKRLILFAGGGQAVAENLTIEGSSPITEDLPLDQLSTTDQEAVVANRRKLTVQRDEAGNVEAVKFGLKRVALSRNG